MKLLVQSMLVLSIFFFACRKDDDLAIPDYSNVSELPGAYSGDNYHTYINPNLEGWVLYSPKIEENNYHSVKINYWSSGIGNIEMEVNGTELTIIDQIDTVTSYGMGGAYVYQYLLKLNATGSYNPHGNSIYLDYIEQTASLGSSDFDTSKVGYISISK